MRVKADAPRKSRGIADRVRRLDLRADSREEELMMRLINDCLLGDGFKDFRRALVRLLKEDREDPS